MEEAKYQIIHKNTLEDKLSAKNNIRILYDITLINHAWL